MTSLAHATQHGFTRLHKPLAAREFLAVCAHFWALHPVTVMSVLAQYIDEIEFLQWCEIVTYRTEKHVTLLSADFLTTKTLCLDTVTRHQPRYAAITAADGLSGAFKDLQIPLPTLPDLGGDMPDQWAVAASDILLSELIARMCPDPKAAAVIDAITKRALGVGAPECSVGFDDFTAWHTVHAVTTSVLLAVGAPGGGYSPTVIQKERKQHNDQYINQY